MLMLYEFRKNLGFFLLMTLVLTLLMSAGVSLFNFSFEINKTVQEDLEKHFTDGYGMWINGDLDSANKMPGVDYHFYDGRYLYFEDISQVDEDEIELDWSTLVFDFQAYYLEDYLPKNFKRAMQSDPHFLNGGRLWTAADNAKTDGRFPIFISQSVVDSAKEYGFNLTVGGVLSVFDMFDEHGMLLCEFTVAGIYDRGDNYEVPRAVVPYAALKEYYAAVGEEITYTRIIINTLSGYKAFTKFAKANGINYSNFIEEDLELVGLFSAVFATVSIVILLLCGAVAYIYCGMYIARRINFIGLLKAMGMTSGRIARQFFVLLIIVLGAALIAGNLFSLVITSHFSNLAFTLFEFELNLGFNFISQLVFAALTVLTAALSVVFIARKIDKISVAATLIQKD